MLANADFVLMLKQAASDRAELKEILNISDELMEYVTGSPKGSGLISYGGSIIPFKDEFPKNELYQLMSSKLDEVVAVEKNSDDTSVA